MPPDSPPDVITPRLIELGMVTENSASMENVLRSAFCSLVGSKFAATVAGGQSAGWLIAQCGALTAVHREMPETDRQAIERALQKCSAANDDRNILVHGVKTASSVPSGNLQTIRSRRNKPVPEVRPWTLAEIHAVVWALTEATGDLFAAIMAAVSEEMMVIDQALAWEERRMQEGAP
jgi:hypothetical protein